MIESQLAQVTKVAIHRYGHGPDDDLGITMVTKVMNMKI